MSNNLLLFVGVGNIGAAHIEVALQQMENGRYKGFKIGIVSRRAAIRSGDLSSLPEQMNLGISIRRQIEPDLLQHLVFYSSIEEALSDPEHAVEAAVVCRDTNEHSQLVRQLRAEGIHVLVEKPLAMDPQEALLAVREHKTKGMLRVAHELYFFSQFTCLANTVDSGLYGDAKLPLGAFQSGTMSRMVKLNDPSIGLPSRKSKCRSPFFDLFVHDGHLSLLMFGRPQTVSILDHRTHPDDPNFLSWAQVQLRWSEGSTMNISAGTFEDDMIPFMHHFELNFLNASIAMDDVGVSILEGERTTPLVLPEPYIGGAIEPLAAEQDLFISQIDGKREDCRVLDAGLALDAVVLADFAEQLALAGSIREPKEIAWLEA